MSEVSELKLSEWESVNVGECLCDWQGDVVKLIRRLDENWYEARAGARQGIVPVIYVETTREPETPLMTPMSSRAPTPVLGSFTSTHLHARIFVIYMRNKLS